jgi:uncharacterized protein YdeI (YjbR/CyaY-like superfamily)
MTKLKPVFFRDQNEFRTWLEKNHKKSSELLVGFYKVASERHNMTWSQSVDQALCFGWIDGIRRSIDSESYCIRFTPRKPTSNWSNVNLKKVEELKRLGLMTKSGLAALEDNKKLKSRTYSYENNPLILDDNFEKLFKEDNNAWEFFMKQAPSYRKAVINWVMSAKQEETRVTRLNKLISACRLGKKIY